MAFYLVFKVGNQPVEGGGHKDGMPVTMLPDGTPISEHMRKVFAIIRMRDEMRPKVLEALEPYMEGGEQVHARSYFADLAQIAQALGKPQLVGQWRSKKVVDIQHGENLPDDIFQRSQGHDFPDIPDPNAITSGTCTIGPGGAAPNYTNWAAFKADLGNLSGDLTATQVADTTGENIGVTAMYLFGYKLRLTCATPHGGDPTAGFKSVKTAGTLEFLRFTLQGDVAIGELEIDNLHFVNSSGSYTDCVYVATTGPTVRIHDCILDNTGATGNGVRVQDSGGGAVATVEVWNCETKGANSGIIISNFKGSNFDVENCTAQDSLIGFDAAGIYAGNSMTFSNNVAVNTVANGFRIQGGMLVDGYNNASTDGTAVTPASTPWANSGANEPNIVAADEFLSTDIANANYMKVWNNPSAPGVVCWDGGRTPLIAGNTAGIRGNARASSIGADEYAAAPPPPGAQRLGLQAKQVQIDTTNLDHRLTSAEKDVQAAVEKIDEVIAITTLDDQDMVALPTTIDEDLVVSTGISATPVEDGLVQVEVNGQRVQVGDGSKVADCYFSDDGGLNPKYLADIEVGDTCHWMGSVAGYQLTTADRISFVYGA